MSPLAEQFTNVIGILALLSHVALIIGIVFVAIQRRNILSVFIQRHILAVSFVIVFAGVGSSLFYSNIIGLLPCTLCWYQRILLFPQLVILFVALLKKDKTIVPYLLALSGVGLLIALIQVLYQFTGISLLSCAVAGGDCGRIYFLEFDYITLPVLSATIFAYLTFIYSVALINRNA